jgi:molecular chaperone DnaK
MKADAEANAEADKKAIENAQKLNEADSLIFQTEKLLEESGDKLSADNKSKIEGALQELKTAYATKDVATIQPALDNLNEIWKTASEEIYKAQAEGQQGGAQPGADASSQSGQSETSDVEDVDFEEVK